MKNSLILLCSLFLIFGMTGTSGAVGYDWETGAEGAFSGGTRQTTGGYNAYGFGDYFYWDDDTITMTLGGLASHDSIDLDFYAAIIDSWDGPGVWGPDYFKITVDGATVFDQALTEYSWPAGSEITWGSNLYNASQWEDEAYNMGLLSELDSIPHTGSSLTVAWTAYGPNWQGGMDESFAIDNVQVVLNSTGPGPTPTPEPGTMILLGAGLLALAGARRKFKR